MASSEVVSHLSRKPPPGPSRHQQSHQNVTTVSVNGVEASSAPSSAASAEVAEAATLLGSVYLHRIGQEILHHKWLLRQR